MSGRSKRRGAFTLIELLVVIAILALLMTILLPSLARAREVGRRTVCQADLRSVGQGFNFYAQQREGRFPNKAAWWNGSDSPPGPAVSRSNWGGTSGWSPYWQSIINWEYYKGNDPMYYPHHSPPINPPDMNPDHNDEPTCGPIIRFWTFFDPVVYKLSYLKTRYSTCPNYKAWGSVGGTSNQWNRPYIANLNAVGGVDWDSQGKDDDPQVWKGQYGKLLPRPNAIYPFYGRYALGTRPEQFSNPNGKFLIFESEYWTEAMTPGNGTADGTVRINADPSVPPWTASVNGTAAFFAFRHMLPPDPSLWQSQAQAAALYVDSHTGVIGPSEKVSLPSKWDVN